MPRRFISRDPLFGAEFSQGTNLYAYCENDFSNANDPTGEDEYKLKVLDIQVHWGDNDGVSNFGATMGGGDGISLSITPGNTDDYDQSQVNLITGDFELGDGKGGLAGDVGFDWSIQGFGDDSLDGSVGLSWEHDGTSLGGGVSDSWDIEHGKSTGLKPYAPSDLWGSSAIIGTGWNIAWGTKKLHEENNKKHGACAK